jgi:hypothetical protein
MIEAIRPPPEDQQRPRGSPRSLGTSCIEGILIFLLGLSSCAGFNIPVTRSPKLTP